MDLTAAEIVDATGGRLLRPSEASGPIHTDTRSFPEGAWFLALSGENFDGHDFLDQVEGSAIGCIVSKEPEGEWSGAVVLVDDTTVALQDLGRWARSRIRVPVIGLTGSSGKTTTRALIALAVGQMGTVHQTVGNLNNQLGVPMTLLATPDEADVLVVEMGTSGPGEIEFLAEIAQPTVRLIVNVGPAHLEELGGLHGVQQEKGAIFRTASPGDICVVNVDDSLVKGIDLPEDVDMVSWGEDGDVRLVEATLDTETLATRAHFATPFGDLEATIQAPGTHVAHNAAGALAVAFSLDLDLARAANAFSRYEAVGMRMRREVLPNGVVVLNDAYNANPDSVRASLNVLAALSGRRIAVLGDMLELGEKEADYHREVVAYADSLGIDLIVLVGKRMLRAATAASATVCWAHTGTEGAVGALRNYIQYGDTILFKGSRGARVERILQSLSEGAG